MCFIHDREVGMFVFAKVLPSVCSKNRWGCVESSKLRLIAVNNGCVLVCWKHLKKQSVRCASRCDEVGHDMGLVMPGIHFQELLESS
jgi:hypothetical protein